MNKAVLLAIFSLFQWCLLPLTGQNFTASNLPIVIIDTNGAPINDEPKTAGTMKIVDNGLGQTNHIDDIALGYDGNIGIELRGSTSQGYDKKPYSLETRDALGEALDFPLLGMPKESDWALICPYNDKSLMRDVLAHKFASQVLPWSPRTRYVEVMINGSYEGVYVLIEKIKRDKNRVDVAKLKSTDLAGDSLTGGYILSMDKFFNSPGGDWASPYEPFPGSTSTTWFQLVYPKRTDIAPAQLTYIRNHLSDFESALHNWQPNSPGIPVYEQWIDVDTWIDYLLVNEISKNVDAYRLSAYFYKDRNDVDGRFKMGPVWDFNIAYGMGDYCEGNTYTGWGKDFNTVCPGDAWVIHFWWEKLCRDTLFQQRVANRWQTLRSSIWTNSKILGCVDSIANLLSEAQVRNFQRWPVLGQYVWPNAFVGQTYQQEVDYLSDWLENRVDWMDNNISMLGPSGLPPFPYIADAEVFPNPANQFVTLKYSTRGFTKAMFYLFDEKGSLAHTPQALPAGDRIAFNVPLNGLASGIYFYRIESLGKELKVGKLEVIAKQ